MYFDFEDYRPDIPRIGRAFTRLEVVLLTIIFHLVMLIVIILSPKWFPALFEARPVKPLFVQQPPHERTQFVFVQPRVDVPAPKPPPRAEPSDLDRRAQAPQRADRPTNPLPYNRGNSLERTIEEMRQREAARGRGAQPDPAAGQMAKNQPPQPETTTPPAP